MEEINLHCGAWADLGARATAVRQEVFVVEQGVPLTLELDDMDAVSLHVLMCNGAGEAIATGRLLPDGHIGRVAVRRSWRGRGFGVVLMQRLIVEARERGFAEVSLNAQVTAHDFYRKLGFEVCGPSFMEADIPHLPMRKTLGEVVV